MNAICLLRVATTMHEARSFATLLVVIGLLTVGVSESAMAQWMALGDGVTHASGDPVVHDVAVASNGDVYIGGYFTEAGGNTSAVAVARWDGSTWHDIGAGFGPMDLVAELVLAENGDLWIGGTFADAGGVAAADNLARYDGTAWYAVDTIAGPDIDGHVDALAIAENGDLFVGGFFTQAGGNLAANRIARWDGATWHAVGSGLDDDGINAATIATGGDLYIGGTYNRIDGSLATARAARWDGSAWTPLGAGFSSGDVAALATTADDHVIVAGGFPEVAGTVGANNVARFDGTTWHPMGSGLGVPGVTNAFSAAVDPHGRIFVGGHFVDGDGNPDIDGIAMWVGAGWEALGSGIAQREGVGGNGHVTALAGADNGVYAGGRFTHSADSSAVLNGIGFFPLLPPTSIDNPTNERNLSASVWPNPATDHAKLELTIDDAVPVRVTLYDAIGREVAVMFNAPLSPGTHTISLDTSHKPAGVYFVLTTAGSAQVVSTLVRR